MKAMGIDIGGTNTAVSICSSAGKTLGRFDFSTPRSKYPEKTISEILRIIDGKYPLDEIGAAGFAVPGMLDPENGFVFSAPNLGWKNFPLKKVLMKYHRFKKLVFENDASCAALGVYSAYRGKKPESLAVLTLGTGIGGGFISGGRIFSRRDISIFEAGHIKISPEGLPCGCGARGCLEAYCGAAYMNNWAGAMFPKALQSSVLSSGEIYEKANGGALWAKKIWKQYGIYLGMAVSDIVNLLVPAQIVFTGGLAGAYSEFKGGLRISLEKHILPSYRGRSLISVHAGACSVGADGAAAMTLL